MLGRILHRCNKCKHHKRNDRILSRCIHCQPENLKCITMGNDKYSTKHKGSFEPSDSISTKNVYIDNNFNYTFETNMGLCTSVKAASSLVSMLPSKLLKDNLLSLLQYPPLNNFNKGIELMVSLAVQMNRLSLPRYLAEIELLPKVEKPHYTPSLILLGIRNYLKTEHVTMPIFNLQIFNFNICHNTTKLAIIACGLKSNRDRKAVELVNYCEVHLHSYFKTPYNCKPTLNTLQSIIILLLELRQFKWVAKLTTEFVNYLVQAKNILGLQFTCPKLSLEAKIERKMVFNSINYIVTMFSTASYFVHPAIQDYPNKLRSSVDFNLKKLNLKSTQSVIHICSLSFNSFLEEFSYHFDKIVFIKAQVAEKLVTFEDCYINIQLIINDFTVSFNKYQKLIKSFKLTSISILYANLLDIYICQGYCLYSYFKFFSLSLKAFHIINETSTQTYTNLLITNALNVVKYILKMPLDYITHIMIATLYHCLLFLLRNRNPEYTKLIDSALILAKSKLLALTLPPYNSSSATFNLNMLNITEDLIIPQYLQL
ncbi:hypothetical protein K502DRAFT_179506 [Neoconidiobolus thromboides FSU 785]|nr:hypothetical protein K502DRAFT_179506 [Neoconidiobolus thromboides FSU 785]